MLTSKYFIKDLLLEKELLNYSDHYGVLLVYDLRLLKY